MGTRSRRRTIGLVAVAVGAAATWVVAAPVIPSGTGAYSGVPMGTMKDLWTGPVSTRIGMKVQTSTGTVRVQNSAGTPLGVVPAGRSAIFEGNWDLLRATPTVGPASWSYETRGDAIAYAGADGTVGTGTVALPANPSPPEVFTVYKSFASTAAYRALTLTAGTATVTVRTSQGGADILTVDAGDWGYAGVGNATLLCVRGNDNVGYGVHDMKDGGAAVSGTASGGVGDTDALFVDPSKALKITLTNTGDVPITVTCSPLTGGVVPVGGTLPLTGAFSQFSWIYGGVGGQVSISVAAD
jgi:hypothetical protein